MVHDDSQLRWPSGVVLAAALLAFFAAFSIVWTARPRRHHMGWETTQPQYWAKVRLAEREATPTWLRFLDAWSPVQAEKSVPGGAFLGILVLGWAVVRSRGREGSGE